MDKAIAIIRKVSQNTDRAVLFHSASGKDSIALLHLMAPYFREIVCVFMYTVKDLEHINRYLTWASHRYPNARFVQIPHFGTYSKIRTGFLGCRQNPKQKLYSLADLTDIVRQRYGIDWVFFGFKMSDSFKRRLMLRQYDDKAINYKTKKCYPLSEYKNGDVLRFIEDNGLIRPETYGGRNQSSGCDVTDIHYLLWLEKNFPADLQRIYAIYPHVERLLFNYENKTE